MTDPLLADRPRDLVPFLKLDEVSLRQMIPQGTVRDFAKGMIVIHEGEQSHALYVILSGSVKVFLSDENGKEFVLGTIEAGDYFGEVALDGGPRTASIVTLAQCRLFVLPKSAVHTLIEHYPEFARDLIGRLIRKVRNLADSVHNLALMSTYCRVIKYLDESAQPTGSGRRVTPRVTHQEIASRIGASREMVTRLIADLVNCGYIAIENKQIVVLKALPER